MSFHNKDLPAVTSDKGHIFATISKEKVKGHAHATSRPRFPALSVDRFQVKLRVIATTVLQ